MGEGERDRQRETEREREAHKMCKCASLIYDHLVWIVVVVMLQYNAHSGNSQLSYLMLDQHRC